jgi:hypothetical protein
MSIFVNHTARSLFMFFIVMIFGLPLVAVLVLWIFSFIGFRSEVFIALLAINYFFFGPIHFIFGSAIVPIQEFGPDPGTTGLIVAILTYAIGSYVLANTIGAIVKKINAGNHTIFG